MSLMAKLRTKKKPPLMLASIALVFGIAGASLLSFDTDYRNYGYIPFLLSTLATVYLMAKVNRNIMFLNIFFSMLNINGIITFLL